jgi:hypothetical protein
MADSPPFRLNLGMVGGGRGAFIGETHRIAARLDDRYELVAGALSSDPQRAIESGRDLRLDPTRCYTDYREMAKAEAARKDGINVVSVATPNALQGNREAISGRLPRTQKETRQRPFPRRQTHHQRKQER